MEPIRTKKAMSMTAPALSPSEPTPGPQPSKRSPIGQSLAAPSEPIGSAAQIDAFDGQTLVLELAEADHSREEDDAEDRDDEEDDRLGTWEVTFSQPIPCPGGITKLATGRNSGKNLCRQFELRTGVS